MSPTRADALLKNLETCADDAMRVPSPANVRALIGAVKHVLIDVFERLDRVEREHRSWRSPL